MANCMTCGFRPAEGSAFCPTCGSKMPAEAADAAETSLIGVNETTVLAKAPADASATTVINRSELPPEAPWLSRAIRKPGYIAAFVGLVVLVFGIAFAAGGGDGGDKDDAAVLPIVSESPSPSVEASPSASPSPTPSESPSPTPTPTVAERPSPSPSVKPDDGSTIDFVMPDLVGKDLQTAQDEIQTHGIFYSKSHDLRGSRSQFVDSNWEVCTEFPVAGTHIKGVDEDWEGKIDFGVVKIGEGCP